MVIKARIVAKAWAPRGALNSRGSAGSRRSGRCSPKKGLGHRARLGSPVWAPRPRGERGSAGRPAGPGLGRSPSSRAPLLICPKGQVGSAEPGGGSGCLFRHVLGGRGGPLPGSFVRSSSGARRVCRSLDCRRRGRPGQATWRPGDDLCGGRMLGSAYPECGLLAPGAEDVCENDVVSIVFISKALVRGNYFPDYTPRSKRKALLLDDPRALQQDCNVER